jgi:hypothetical protein
MHDAIEVAHAARAANPERWFVIHVDKAAAVRVVRER